MADFGCTVTVINGSPSFALTRISRYAYKGSWYTPPTPTIAPNHSDIMSMTPANNVSEGAVTYKTHTADEIRVYFKCDASGNTCTVMPASMAQVVVSSTGSALVASVTIFED